MAKPERPIGTSIPTRASSPVVVTTTFRATGFPHLGHATAFSTISEPHLVQNMDYSTSVRIAAKK